MTKKKFVDSFENKTKQILENEIIVNESVDFRLECPSDEKIDSHHEWRFNNENKFYNDNEFVKINQEILLIKNISDDFNGYFSCQSISSENYLTEYIFPVRVIKKTLPRRFVKIQVLLLYFHI